MSEVRPRRPRRGRGRSEGERYAGEEAAQRRTARLDRRRALVPVITYPAELPVVARKDDIAAAIRDHQVVIVAGETGSGKTTQIPKIALELGRGIGAMIGHTQPRRIAARSVAERIAEELDTPLGAVVGYQVRFADHSTRDTLVKVMTDGILLAEMQHDRDLRRYDTIVIDEAHERSLNVDFLLGYLKQLLPRRPDLKLVITSATIDPGRFSRHFDDAPVIEVSGRTYPVQIRYRPLAGDTPEEDRDQVTGVCDAVEELWTESRAGSEGGSDILVFLSGEREIRDTADALAALRLPQTEILPLYARLSAPEQHRVFGAHSGRRVVLATNVAETSLTVPGIRYVVDAGTARISRYSQRTKVQRLPIEPVSQASAAQRAGRCGRLADGIAIRLYSEEDLQARPRFTDPEILRTNLASVLLAMASLRLGDVARFPFLDPPDPRQVADGTRLLEELQALEPPKPPKAGAMAGAMADATSRGRGPADRTEPRRRLTAYGQLIARLPVDPRLARMVVEADRNGALAEVLVIAAALSIQDPRERPTDRQQAADEKHRRFADEHSDFTSLLNLWGYVREQQRERSGSAFRRMCKAEFLHYLRVREWQDLHSQLRQGAKELGMHPNQQPASADAVHQALLAGLLSRVGLRDVDKRDYLGARGARFAISPGSALFRTPPQWVMSAELVETSRLWARVNARTDPAWVERLADHLVKRSYSEPHWERKRASAVALERVLLYGIPLVAGRKVGYAAVDPAASRDIFIRQALVEGDWDTHHRFFHDNRRLLEELGELEHRARRRDLIVDDETLVDFYDRRIPAEVVSGAHFDAWWKKVRRQDPQLLTFSPELLLSEDPTAALAQDHPYAWRQGPVELAVSYQFQPGSAADGVTVHVPVHLLNQVHDRGFDWQVRGLRQDLAEALLRSLPKATRRQLVPAPDRARAALADADPDRGSVTDELARVLRSQTGVVIEPQEWDWSRVPDHLRITFSVESADGEVVAQGKDLSELKARAAPQVLRTIARAASGIERTGLRTWDFGDLPPVFEAAQGAHAVQGFPALVDQGDSVSVQVLDSRADAAAATRLGVRRLLLIGTAPPWRQVLAALDNTEKLALGHNPHGSVPALLDDVLACAVDTLSARRAGGDIRTAADFAGAAAEVRSEVVPTVLDILGAVVPVLSLAREARLGVSTLTSPRAAGLRADLEAQLDDLVHGGFVTETGWPQLRQVVRYLRGMLLRVERAPEDLARDAERAATVRRAQEEYAAVLASLPPAERWSPEVRRLRWMLQELRVSLFAQTLGTAYPVSEQRIAKAVDALRR